MLSLILPVALAFPAGVDTLSVEDAPVHSLGNDQWHLPHSIESIASAGALVAVGSGPAVLIFDPVEGRRVTRHRAGCAPLRAVAWSDDLVVAGCNNPILTNRSLFAWRPGETEPVLVAATPAPVSAVAPLEVDGEDVVVAGLTSGEVVLVRVRDARTLGRFEVEGAVRRMAVRDAQTIEISTDSDAYLLKDGALVPLGAPPEDPIDRRLAAAGIEVPTRRPRAITDAGLLVTAGKYGRVMKVHDIERRRDVHQGHGAAINGQAVSPDGQRVATIDLEGEVKVWHIATGEVLDMWHIPPPADVIGVATEGALVAWLDDTTLRVGSGSGGMFTLAHDQAPVQVAERALVVGGAIAGDRAALLDRDGQVTVRTLGPKGKNLWNSGRLLDRRERVVRTLLSADGQRVVTIARSNRTRTVRLHEGRSGKVLWQADGLDAALSADGRVLVVADAGELITYDLPAAERRSARPQAPQERARSVQAARPKALALDATGQRLAVADGDGVRLYRVGSAEPAVIYQEGVGTPPGWLHFADGFLITHAPEAPSLRALTLPPDVVVAEGWPFAR